MKRPVLVTVSGMIGSGKSTVLRHLLRVLQDEGIAATEWRFQQLPCFTLRPPRSHRTDAAAMAPAPPAERGRGYRRKPLTATRTLGYLARMASFAVFRRLPRREACVIANRYFYDNLVHYDLDAPRARFYAALLTRHMPRPDIAFLLLASPETIAARRPNYSQDYIDPVGRAYRQLPERFPRLIAIPSDAGEPTLQRAEAALREGWEVSLKSRI